MAIDENSEDPQRDIQVWIRCQSNLDNSSQDISPKKSWWRLRKHIGITKVCGIHPPGSINVFNVYQSGVKWLTDIAIPQTQQRMVCSAASTLELVVSLK